MNETLALKLNYSFTNLKLLKLALTHRSSDNENNERLEFLGDSIVNFVIAEALYEKFPEAQEGELSRWRASLVNRDTLGELAQKLELGKYLFLGAGELKGGEVRQSILSCSIEAIIGAIYLDGGFLAVRQCIFKWYRPLLNSLSKASDHRDPKTQLQEYLQSMRLSLPIYTVDSIQGEAHQQMFTVSCKVESIAEKSTGKGTSRRRAEQDAAEKMLKAIKK